MFALFTTLVKMSQTQIQGFLDEKVFATLISKTSNPVKLIEEKNFKAAVKELGLKKDNQTLSRLYYANNHFKESLESLDLAIASKQNLANDQATLWAKLSLHLILKDHAKALEVLFALKYLLDSPSGLGTQSTFSAVSGGSSGGNGQVQKQVLLARAWWIHHALLLLPHAGPKLHMIGETFYSWINVIETTCPWMLRYLAYIYIVVGCGGGGSGGKKYPLALLKDIGNALSVNSYLYSDALTSLVCTSINLDFNEASGALKKCEELVKSDAFVGHVVEVGAFMSSARVYLFTFYCRVHTTISFETACKVLHLEAPALKTWLDKFIADRVDGAEVKVTVSASNITVKIPKTRVFDDVLSKCKILNDRSAGFEKIVAV